MSNSLFTKLGGTQPNQDGFTLVELLIVAAIIAMLATIVVVSIIRARQTAHNAVRAQFIGQLEVALEAYASDNDNQYPIATSVQVFSENTPTPFLQELIDQGYFATFDDYKKYYRDTTVLYYIYTGPGGASFLSGYRCGTKENKGYVIASRYEGEAGVLPGPYLAISETINFPAGNCAACQLFICK